MANVLVIRLSAIGDVAMTIPVLYAVAKLNPQDTFTLLTQPFLQSLFINPPANVQVIAIDAKGPEGTFWGLMKYTRKLSRDKYDVVIDLQNRLNTQLISGLVKLKGQKVFRLDQMKEARKKLVRKDNKALKPIRQTVDRYSDVFVRAGFKYKEDFDSLYASSMPDDGFIADEYGEKGADKWIGIAPFAKFRGKTYSIDEMEVVVDHLSKLPQTKVFLFGARGYEQAVLEEWDYRYDNVHSVVGKYTLDKELMLIHRLNLLVSMDSANMHFASLVRTPVISLWGATHPYSGFYGYKQDPDDAIQAPLLCRPCSVYGKKACYRGDWACFKWITPEMVIEKVKEKIS